MSKLDPKATGIAVGGTLALGLVLLALITMIHGHYGAPAISMISNVYLGYRPTIPGALIGGIWGFVDGGIAGYIFAWIYNKSLK